MNRLLANGAGLPGLSEPGVHAAAVVGMSTGEYPQLVSILIFIQADGTDIILVSLLIVMCRNLFQLLFGKSIPLEPFPVLDTTNYHCSTPCSEVHWNSHCVLQRHHIQPSGHLGP